MHGATGPPKYTLFRAVSKLKNLIVSQQCYWRLKSFYTLRWVEWQTDTDVSTYRSAFHLQRLAVSLGGLTIKMQVLFSFETSANIHQSMCRNVLKQSKKILLASGGEGIATSRNASKSSAVVMVQPAFQKTWISTLKDLRVFPENMMSPLSALTTRSTTQCYKRIIFGDKVFDSREMFVICIKFKHSIYSSVCTACQTKI